MLYNNTMRKKIPSGIKDILWRRIYGNSLDSQCLICKSPITYLNCHIAHKIAVKHGGDDHIDNLEIICQTCNLSMQTTKFDDYVKKYLEFKETYSTKYYTSVFKILS